jgi:RNA polymerase sigma-70 factor (ECF subfamily)
MRKSDFQQIYKQYKNDVINVINMKVKDLATSEDLCSEAFMKVYNNIEKYDESKAKFNTWLYTIVNNHVIDYLRKESANMKQTVLTSDFVNENGKETFQIESIDNAVMENDELKNSIYKALRTMKSSYRKIAIMHYLNGNKLQEISDILDMPLNSVKVNLMRVREVLQVELKQEYAAL